MFYDGEMLVNIVRQKKVELCYKPSGSTQHQFNYKMQRELIVHRKENLEIKQKFASLIFALASKLLVLPKPCIFTNMAILHNVLQ